MASVGTRLFTATAHFLRTKPMLNEDEIRSMFTLKEYLDRVYRYHRRRSSMSRSSGSRRSVGLVASRAETECGLATAAIKGILCAVHPFTELSEYEVNTSVFEKLFGTTIAFYWSLYKPIATKIAVATTLWSLLYNSPLQDQFYHVISETVCRFISMFAILWLVLYFWSQLNWRMSVTVLGYFDAWFFITQAILYAIAIMALYEWDVVVVVYNVFGILGFSAVIAYDAYPLSMRNLAKYMLFAIMVCLCGGMVMMSLDSGFMDRSLHMDVMHGLVHANCHVDGNLTLTWSFNVYDFAIQRLQILTVYMMRNTYWAFNAPRYCVIIKSRVALEEVPVIGVRVVPAEAQLGRRNTLVRQSFKESNRALGTPQPDQVTSRPMGSSLGASTAAGTPAAASTTIFVSESSRKVTPTLLQPNTGPLYALHPIQNNAIHTYDGHHRMSIVSVPNVDMLASKSSADYDVDTDNISTDPGGLLDEAASSTVVMSAVLPVHRPPKPTTSLHLPKLSTQKLLLGNVIGSRHMTNGSLRTSTAQSAIPTLSRGNGLRIPVKTRKSSSFPRNLHALSGAPKPASMAQVSQAKSGHAHERK
ncbi:hypothetical protein DYB32_005773 [Aphanomyces invadans]|uniref:Uncharacterized protein n=1 Tax=Aphanomyces invadans TaxID=157072 RepID=A0A418ATL7_9STRA|nr:hypothetical protein DYB32_005773 [Aphanomyces invadans]